MRLIPTTTLIGKARRTFAACALVLLAGCMDLSNVPNYDNESLDALVDDPGFMLNRLPESWRAKVLHENAAELYGARLGLPAVG